MEAALPWLAGGAAGFSALSGLSNANQQSKQSNLNAQLLDQQARNTALQTGSQVSQIRRQGANVMGEQAAAFADNGTGTGGSNALIQRSTAIDTEMDAANADYNGQLQINDLKNQASSMRATAKNQQPGLLSLVGGAASTLGSYYGTKSLLKG
ncbi:hypothetical protein N2K17_01685 [Klebsiella michiganensis]|uniref:virion core protein, T7 gp14 family n=1 Tax=Klebsiella michiganensis TaxID=1134687 RepID=UPI0022570D9D|nr:hypothetical protein [Klebsiella michiganensis]MCX3078451.1 hypothetical protein [Klebsiella michiganensis]MCY0817742.1 hypothetical protein [Klebsiella michiganensis]